MTLGALAFASPWVLTALLALPALWWLLRVTPPAPRRQRFPAVRLLKGLRSDEHVTAHTPWWLLLLRLVVAALVVLGLSRPLIEGEAGAPADTALVLVIDDGWAAAADWADRREAAESLLDRAERDGRPVVLLPTAARPGEDPPPLPKPVPASEARSALRAMAPQPWATDPGAVRALLAQTPFSPPATVSWIHDGLDAPGLTTLAGELNTLGPLTVWRGRESARGASPLLLDPPSRQGESLVATVRRPGGEASPGETVWVQLRDGEGRLVSRERASLEAGADTARVVLPLVEAGSENLARVDLSRGETARPIASAGAVALLDDSWRRRPVGLVVREDSQGVPLLDPLHYPRRALAPRAIPEEGSITALVQRPLSVIILPDIAPLAPVESGALDHWVRGGGTLIRFAGPRPDNASDTLLPVPLRGGDRRLGGALSWSEPARLAPFPSDSPFAGLPVPREVTVSSQVLAEPNADLESHTWARLDDGTPLVTAASRGEGRIVLFHVTSDPRWSNLPLSILFERMLERLVDQANGIAGAQGREGAPLAPWRVLDGFGRLMPAGPLVSPLPAGTGDGPPITVGPGHPPGLYGDETGGRALNLAPSITGLGPVAKWPLGSRLRSLSDLGHSIDLMPWLLTAALALALLDMAISLMLRGLGPGGRRPLAKTRTGATAAALLLSLGLGLGGAPGEGHAQSPPDPTNLDDATMEAALDTRLAYVITGDVAVDRVSQSGLLALTEVLSRRTSAELAPPRGIDLDRDDPLVHPLLYWPAVTGAPPLSEEARAHLNAFIRGGGLLVIDSRDGAGDTRPMAEGLDIPPLRQAPEDHVLTRSFYLLDAFPGRVMGQPTWVAAQGGDNDGVSPVVVGGNDWAAAWAHDGDRGYLFPLTPGGEAQREMAYRFGVNLVMYALTGNYKGDQVHLPAILERLTN